MRVSVFSITAAALLFLPSASLAGSRQVNPGTHETVRKGDPKLYADVRIRLKKGGKVDGWWVSRRDDAVCVLESGKLRWIPNAEIRDIKDPSKPGFWKKVWSVAKVPGIVVVLPVMAAGFLVVGVVTDLTSYW